MRETLRTSSWWSLAGAHFYEIALIGILAYVIFRAEDLDLSRDTAVSILNLHVPAAVFGGLIGGYFSDWYVARF